MVTILRWRVPAMFLVYTFIVALLVVSIILPWVHSSVTLSKLVDILSAEGSLSFTIYLWGHYDLSGSITAYTGEGTAVSIPFPSIAGTVSAMYLVLACVIVVLVINLLLALTELGKFSFLERITGGLRFILETASIFISLLVSIYFAFFHNTFRVADSNVGALKSYLLTVALDVSSTFTHTSISYSFSWGPGYLMFFLSTIIMLLIYIDRYVFTEMLELSSMWKFRGHLCLFALFMSAFPITEAVIGESFHMWSGLHHIVVFEYGYIAESNPSVFIKMVVLIYLDVIIFMLGTTILPSRHIMKSTPFITLTLPDEEILRRHKMLPKVTRWKRIVDLSISIIAFLSLAYLYIGLIRGLGGLTLAITKYGGEIPESIIQEAPWITAWSIPASAGVSWTTPPAYILTIVLLIQALIVLKPTR